MHKLYLVLFSFVVANPAYCVMKSKDVAQVNKLGKVQKAPIKMPPPNLGYSYMSFDYNSTNGASYKRYNGSSNVGGIGLGFFPVAMKVLANINFITIDTRVNASQSIAAADMLDRDAHVKTSSNIFAVNLLRPISNYWFIGAAGSFGYTKNDNTVTLAPGTENSASGFYKSNGNIASVAATLLYRKSLLKWRMTAWGNIAYNRVTVDKSTVYYPTPYGVIQNPNFINNSLFSREGLELSYYVNRQLEPYIDTSLIQVLKNKYNRTIVPASATGPLPQLVLDSGGYNLGAGARLFGGLLRVGYRYTHRGPFDSYIVSAKLTVPVA